MDYVTSKLSRERLSSAKRAMIWFISEGESFGFSPKVKLFEQPIIDENRGLNKTSFSALSELFYEGCGLLITYGMFARWIQQKLSRCYWVGRVHHRWVLEFHVGFVWFDCVGLIRARKFILEIFFRKTKNTFRLICSSDMMHSFFIPIKRHFWIRQAWQCLLLFLLILQLPSYAHRNCFPAWNQNVKPSSRVQQNSDSSVGSLLIRRFSRSENKIHVMRLGRNQFQFCGKELSSRPSLGKFDATGEKGIEDNLEFMLKSDLC